MSAAILCQVPLFGSMLHRSQSGIVLDRKLFLWLASHSIGGLRVPRVDLMHLRNALYLDVRPKTWIAGLRNVAPESGEETLEIDVVRRALSLSDIYFSDAQWRSLLHRVRDAHTIEIPSDADGDAPEQIGVFAADPGAAAQIVVAHAAQPVGNPEPAADQFVPHNAGSSKRKYEDLSHDDLIRVVQQRNKEIKRLNSTIRQKNCRARRKNAEHLDLCAAVQAERCSVLSVPAHVNNKKLGVDKMLAVGLRRNMSSIGAHNYGLVVGEDISRQSVCKAETCAAWQLTNRAKWWVADRLGEMVTPGRPGICVFCVSYVCDATNSSIWQQRKLQGLIAEVRFSAGSGTRSVLKQAADLLPVEDGSSRGAEVFV